MATRSAMNGLSDRRRAHLIAFETRLKALPMPIDRSALRAAYRLDEETCIEERLQQAGPAAAIHSQAAALAARLIGDARKRKPGALDSFLATFGLGTEE